MKLIVILFILSLLAAAAVASFSAKPAGATEIVCKPMPFNDIPHVKRIVRA